MVEPKVKTAYGSCTNTAILKEVDLWHRRAGGVNVPSNGRAAMAAYCLFDNLEVLDSGKLEEYRTRVAPVVEHYGGRYVVLGGKVDVMEGQWRPTFPVMIEFPDLDRAHQWYASNEYRELKAICLSAVRSTAVFLEGL